MAITFLSKTKLKEKYLNTLRRKHDSVKESSLPESTSTQEDDISAHFIRRANSYINGVELIIKHSKLSEADKKKYNHYLKTQEESFQQAIKNDPKRAKKLLKKILGDLVLLISTTLDISVKKAWKSLKLSENFVTWDSERTPITTDNQSSTTNKFIFTQIEIPKTHHTDQQIKTWLEVYDVPAPEWFTNLPNWAQTYLKRKFKSVKAIQKNNSKITDETRNEFHRIMKLIPAGLRSIPGLANHSEHTFTVKDPKGNEILKNTRTRFSIPSPIDIRDAELRQALTRENIEQLLETYVKELGRQFIEKYKIVSTEPIVIDIPILIQTLVSPLHVDSDIFSENNSDMLRQKEAAITHLVSTSELIKKGVDIGNITIKPIIISTNHPINSGRNSPLLDRSWEKKNDENEKILFKQIASFLKVCFSSQKIPKDFQEGIGLLIDYLSIDDPKNLSPLILKTIDSLLEKQGLQAQYPELHLLLSATRNYIDCLYNPEDKKQPDPDRHLNLFKSSLEQIIVTTMSGLGSGGCKSSKDRKGLETIHTNTILAAYAMHKKLPGYYDSPGKRDSFINLFINIFNTKHQHRVADEFNAPGSHGLKSLKSNLPRDILKAFVRKERGILKKEKTLSAINKPQNPFQAIPKMSTMTVLKMATGLYPLLWLQKKIYQKKFAIPQRKRDQQKSIKQAASEAADTLKYRIN